MVVHQSERAKSNVERKSSGHIWPEWYPILATFRNSDNRKATWQLINTVVPYCVIWYLMIRSIQLGYSYALTLILALPAAAFMVRLFILFQDFVHGSFFRRPRVNTFSATSSGCWYSLLLKKCYDAVPALQAKAPLTVVESLSCIRLKMWDEKRQEMVAFH